jgi:hypothetical protein
MMHTCPKCGGLMKPGQIRAAGPFPCPICQTQIQAPPSYGHWVHFLSVVASATTFWAFGLRRFHLLYAVLLAWWPVLVLAMNLVKYIVPPRIKIAAPVKPISEILRNGKEEVSQSLRKGKDDVSRILREGRQRTVLNLDDKKRR